MRKEKGITLIALIITIVVLLILASISIKVLTGDNGLINQTKNGKDASEISEEKEIVNISAAQAIEKDIAGDLKTEEFRKKLNSNAGEGKTEVIDSGETIVAKFVEKNRYYEIDKDGNVEGPKEQIKDENAGDITKGGTLDGSKEKPFQINCIEDLVEFSMMINGGNESLGINFEDFKGKYVELMRTLDFNSIFSYKDYKTTQYGDLNEDGIIDEIRTELIKQDENCIGFKPMGSRTSNKSFCGVFNGNNYEIRNIYEKIEGVCGLFGEVSGATIKNMTVTGTIKSINHGSGGVSGGAGKSNFINCINKINIIQTGYEASDTTHSGGIIGSGSGNMIINCSNEGNIEGENAVGGIVGCASSSEMINCYNIGNLKGKSGKNYGGVGGIVGLGEVNIYNCYNIGQIESYNILGLPYADAGGILGSSSRIPTNNFIMNVYNIGKVYKRGSRVAIGGIVGGYWYEASNVINVKNAYYEEQEDMTGYGKITTDSEGINKKTKEYMYSEQLVSALNEYIETNPDGIDVTEWKKWKVGEKGYPVFE